MRNLRIVVACLAVGAAGCGASKSSRAPEPTEAVGKVEQPWPAKRTARLPGAPAAYAKANARALRLGRATVKMIIAQDENWLHTRFTKRLATAVPKTQLSTQLAAIGPLIKRAKFASDDTIATIYTAEYTTSRRRFSISVGVDKTGKISGLGVNPITKLRRDPMASYQSKTRFRLPFNGTWWMLWGGKSARQNYHVVVADQRHAYDIVMWRDGAAYRGDGTRNEDYWAFGKQILAPADGEVIVAIDGIKDNKPKLERNRTQIAGNHVLLKVAEAEYVLMGHFKQGTVRVKPGARVKRGDVLGLCGNSGNSTEPHLHIHLQNSAKLFKSTGLPMVFDNYAADGKRIKAGSPVRGEFVTSLPQ